MYLFNLKKTSCILSFSFHIYLTVPPYIENDQGDHYEFLRGETVNLECPILGAPQPVYVWEHNNSHPFNAYVLIANIFSAFAVLLKPIHQHFFIDFFQS